MKTIFFMVMIFSINSYAGTATCSQIREHDSRMMCFAVSSGSSSYCGFIKDHDARIKCYVATGK